MAVKDMRFLLIFGLVLQCLTASAESVSFGLKPANGLSGTASLTLHEDGKVTLLTYESATRISEDSIALDDARKLELRNAILTALNSYLSGEEFDALELSAFSVSFTHTRQEVTKSVTTRRLNFEAREALKQVFSIAPSVTADYETESSN